MSNLRAWYQAKKVRQAQYEIAAEMEGDAAKRTKFEQKAEKYNKRDEKDSLPELDERAVEKEKKAERLKAEAREMYDESEYVHLQAGRLDMAHLLAEISLVLCSITLLTKRKSFWYAGLLATVIAIGLTASAHMLPREEHHHTTSHA
jgi:hypothetical protein